VTSILRDIPRHRLWIAAACLLAVALCVAGALATPDELTAADAALLGMVEGFTEYLPVSSTGHLLVTQRLLGIGESGVEKDAVDSELNAWVTRSRFIDSRAAASSCSTSKRASRSMRSLRARASASTASRSTRAASRISFFTRSMSWSMRSSLDS
jgi:hypothetical protein